MSQVLLLLPQVVCLLHLHQDPLCQGVQVGREPPQPSWHHQLTPFEPLPPPQEGAIVKHVLGQGVQGPEVPLAGVTRLPRHLDKAVIETEVMADRVLPLGELFLVIRKSVHDELTDAAEGESLLGRLEYAHTDQSLAGVGRLNHTCHLANIIILLPLPPQIYLLLRQNIFLAFQIVFCLFQGFLLNLQKIFLIPQFLLLNLQFIFSVIFILFTLNIHP